jgi:hypothetical protein
MALLGTVLLAIVILLLSPLILIFGSMFLLLGGLLALAYAFAGWTGVFVLVGGGIAMKLAEAIDSK